MSRLDIRSPKNHRFSFLSPNSLAGRLLRRSGRAEGARGTVEAEETAGRSQAANIFERLEERVLLGADEPNFNQVFGTPSPATPPVITLDGQGVGTSPTGGGLSTISPAGDDDVFSFTAPSSDFVRIWADTVATASGLDSRVEVYTGTPGGTATLVAAGSTQGTLTTGVFRDGWVGFRANAGTTYYVVVKSDTLIGASATGEYILRINALSTPFPALNTTTGAGTAAGSITLPGGDVVYRLTTGFEEAFAGVLTAIVKANPADLDPRLDIYDQNGNFITGDSDTGNLSDAYAAVRSSPNRTFYIRVRSDEFGNPATTPSTGAFSLVLDGIATDVPLDPVTRVGGIIEGVATQSDISFLTFQSQGSGLTIASLVPTPMGGIPDSALRIYNDQGVMIGFNELPDPRSRLFITLTGGETYFIVVENFDGSAGGGFILEIESHHTFINSMPVDDHVNTPAGFNPASPPAFGSPEWFTANRQFELATPIIWNPPEPAPTPYDPLLGPLPGLPPVSTPDHSSVILGFGQGRIHAAGDTDLFQFVVPVDMLGEYEGRDNDPPPMAPPLWQQNYRPATSLQVLVQRTLNFLNAQVRILDSNLQQIYPASGTNDILLTPGFPDPAGALDPASFPPELPIDIYGYTFAGGQPARIDIWAGEVYYLEVSGSGSGRYALQLQADAHTDDPAVSTFYPMVPNAGGFNASPEILIDPNTGEGDILGNVAGGSVLEVPPGSGVFTAVAGNAFGMNLGRAYAANLTLPAPAGTGAGVDPGAFMGTPGSKGRLILRMSDLGMIQTIDDTDLYQFRALYTGMAEVRIATTQIADEFFEAVINTEDGDPMTPPEIDITTKTKTYNSPFDSALRIFDNDQTQIAYNNDSAAVTGDYVTTFVGSYTRTFTGRDARAVFPVVAGRNYYIQVESGQRNNTGLIDWRHATGSYELLVNSMPNLNFDDDHINAGPVAQTTPIPIDLTISDPEAVLGSVQGEIRNTLANPVDSDAFQFIAPTDGRATITVSVMPGSSFSRGLFVFNEAGQLIGADDALGTEDASIDILTIRGDRIFVVVDGGLGAEQGFYEVKVSGIPFADDHASIPNLSNATHIDKDLYDYDGTETIAGSIESRADVDLFSFETIAFDIATITVQSLSTSTFRPLVRVFELGEDLVGNPVPLQIAHQTATESTAQVSFSLTAPPRQSTVSGQPRTIYYVMVSGVDPDEDWGDYELTITFNVTTDDHPDAGQYEIATPVNVGSGGQGFSSGFIELVGDTDLFTFTALATGPTTVDIISPNISELLARVRIFDADGNPVPNNNGLFFITGPDEDISIARFQFTAVRDVQYFIQVEGVLEPANVVKTAETGRYTLGVTTTIPDDHPNAGEFNIATTIILSPFSGDGSANGVINPGVDTDLFRFETITNGSLVVTVTSPGNQFRPFLRFFGEDEQEIGVAVRDGGPGDEDNQLNGSVTRTLSGALADELYYILVSSDQTEPSNHRTGDFFVIVNGDAIAGGSDDHANAGDYENATLIQLSTLTGDATVTGNIEAPGDTDLFVFNSLAGSTQRPLRAYVQVLTPNGSPLDVGVRIITQIDGGAHQVIVTNTAGGLGTNAEATFDIDAPNRKYWVEVDGLSNVGSYTVKIDTAPSTYFLYYPEGFANSNIREYVSLGNTNDFAVNYTIRFRYETNDPEHVITGVIGPNSRGGITVSDGTANPGSGILFNKPYAIIIESDGFIAASISHYDFGTTLGEAFTGRTSTMWSFGQGERQPGVVADFLLYYNPNPTPVVVTLTAHQTDPDTGVVTTVAMSQTVQGFRRLGWNFNATPALPIGKFAFTVTSAPANPSDPHIGIVAALSHNELALADGWAVLGDPDGGATTAVVPGIINSGGEAPEITLFNSSGAATTVGIVGRYINTALPDVIRNVTLQPFQTRRLSAVDLGLVANQQIGLRFDAASKVTVLQSSRRGGDADATHANNDTAASHFFGDAFINSLRAGTLYFEDMFFYNPDTAALPVTLNFVFNTGETRSYSFVIGPKSFTSVALHTLPAILTHRVFNYFSVNATAPRPFAATMNHYDLVLAGGWGTKGAPLGLTVPLSSIT